MRYKALGLTGEQVSILGFGASPLGNVFGDVDLSECTRAVHAAVDLGVNFFDVSPYYGLTLAEERLGQTLAGRRDKVFLATKCGRYGQHSFDFSAARVKASIDDSLLRLKTDRVDLLQAHDIEFGNKRQIVEETIPALHELKKQGKARYIGVTGYQLKMLRDVASKAEVDTVLSYCRYNLLIDDMNTLLLPSIQQRGVGLINASPFHMALLSGQAVPSWHPAPAKVKQGATAVLAACAEQGVDPVQLALRYCFDHPYVATTLAGMSTEQQVKANLSALDWQPDIDINNILDAIPPDARQVTWPSGRAENEDYNMKRDSAS